jgi:hypothetical protein
VHAARALAALPADIGSHLREWISREVMRRDREAGEALAALTSGTRPAHAWRTPLYRCHRFAIEAGVRATLWLAMASAVFVLGGWSATAISLTQVAVIIGLGATAPDPRRFTLMALIAGVIATLCAGVLEFLVLDGATEFPLLALALAPVVVGAALLLARPNAAVSAAGRMTLVNVLVILGPSNPQSYNPETFLDVSLFVCLAAVLMMAAQVLIPPVSDEYRRRWMIASARGELARLSSPRRARYAPEEAMFRDAVRIGQIGTLRAPAAQLGEALRLFDQAGMIRLREQRLAR